MKFICDRNLLLKEIAFAQEIISSRNAVSILSNVLLSTENEALIIKATDLKVSFESSIPVSVIEPGNTTVFCDKLFNILNSVPQGELDFEIVDLKLLIKTPDKKIKFQLKSLASDKYPEFPLAKENGISFDFPISDIKDMINQTVFAVSDDETRYFMNGVFLEKHFDKLNMIATDGRRLSIIKKNISQNVPEINGIIIPPKVLNLVNKKYSNEGLININISDKYIYFKHGLSCFSSVLIEGQFPNYKRVIPENQSYFFSVDKNILLNAIKRVSLLVEQKSKRVYLCINSDILSIVSEESDIGDAIEEISCEYKGNTMKIAINYKYLEDPLRVIDDERIKFYFSEPNKAISIYPFIDKGFFHIIMPMQFE